tara:strand:- start:627 stop:1649 length:1023 start_codon:yes stop_codon:yes gene_type:complete
MIRRALDQSADKERYLRRQKSNPTLTELGLVPCKVEEIVDEQQPELFHALAFRMATYDDVYDDLFHRWEKLLKGAKVANGWSDEYAHWNNKGDHWAIKWDKFNQFLWLLQCFEYFSDKGYEVSFPASRSAAKPDLCVVQADKTEKYVECFFYTKWWGREHLLKDLLSALDDKLIIKRPHNISFAESDNPMSGKCDTPFVEALAILGDSLAGKKLAALRAAAEKASPQFVCDVGIIQVLIEGNGEYQPDLNNAHGNPETSWPVYVNEIIRNKENSNGLAYHHPNLVMVNGLGWDFQSSLDDRHQNFDLPASLDEIWIYRCGIDDKIEARNPIRLRSGNPRE